MPGLGTSFGRGGATNSLQDLVNADCILIEGSNFAEAHPVGFRFVMQAKERGCKVIHVDPRFTRTSALADLFVPIRSGTDIAFLGGIINWIIANERYFGEYVRAYTNAGHIVTEEFRDTEDLDGLFSGLDEPPPVDSVLPHVAMYDRRTWRFETTGNAIVNDPTLQHPRCVFQILKRHFSRYTPEMVARICGTPVAKFLEVCTALAENSGRERTTAFAYALGWTQHNTGVQYIRTASILQLLLGNVGRPGGGIMALRGHANIQGATDIATLYDLLPGYLPMPSALRDEQTLSGYLRDHTKRTGWWANTPKYVVSLLKAFYGAAATRENAFCYDYLPQLTGDHSELPTTFAMKDGHVKGYFVIGQNPAASGQNGELTRAAMERLEWMVNVDSFETETASFWNREGVDPTAIATEVFFLPAATILEKDGVMVNTSRMLQFHDKALEPQGESKSDAWYLYQLGKRLKALYAFSTDPKDRPILDMTWEYEHEDERERLRGEPSVNTVMREVNGFYIVTGAQVSGFAELADDGSTAAGGWIYSGVCPDEHTNRARSRRNGDNAVSADWGFAWPANRRLMYNRASADTAGKPWSERKKYIWWDEHARRWTGADVPDFPLEKAPDTPANPDARGIDAHSGCDPFLMQDDGRGALFVSSELQDGPMPTHYEPLASVVPNALYAQQHDPLLRQWKRRDNPYNHPIDPEYPYVLTTYRVTEYSGGLTKHVPWLAELQPAAFCEIDPVLAAEKGIRNGDWATIATAVGEIEALVLVTNRMKPLRLPDGQCVHQIGVPYNYGRYGLARGDSPNDLVPISTDPNSSIHEAKSLTCSIRAGRRPRRNAATNPVDADVPDDQKTVDGDAVLHGTYHDFPHEHPVCG